MRLYSHALKFFLLPAFAILAARISVYHPDAVGGEDFVLVKQAEKSAPHCVGRTLGKVQLSDPFVKTIMHNAGLPILSLMSRHLAIYRPPFSPRALSLMSTTTSQGA
jgi:hypothetical protein